MKNILVTGGAGYIGSHIVEQLIKLKKKVIIVDNLSTGKRRLINKKAKFYKGDIKNSNKVDFVIKKNKIDSVIHLAASLSVGESQKKPKKLILILLILIWSFIVLINTSWKILNPKSFILEPKS